ARSINAMADAVRKIVDRKELAKRQLNFEQQIKATAQAIERRKELWNALSKFIHDQGCWVVSRPHVKDVRIQMPKNSSLPVKLRELGYDPQSIGVGVRAQTGKFLPVDIIEIVIR